MPLTQKQIDACKPRAKPYRSWDADGMYLEVTPAGGRWWRLAYRYEGKRKLLSLGTYPEVTLANARTRRHDARELLAAGTDPSANRKALKRAVRTAAANSFEAIAREWHGKRVATWAPTHAADVMRRLEANLFPEIGGKPIKDINAQTVLAAARKVESRGAHDLSHRMVGVASQVFRYAVSTGACDSDPCRDLRGALTPNSARKQAAVKLEEFPALLRAMEGYAEIGDQQTALALRLLCLTFVRTNELIGAERTEFKGLDGDAPLWEIPAERMKLTVKDKDDDNNAHFVPLSRQAVAVIKELMGLSSGSRFLLPGRNPDKPISNNTLLFALYRLGYKGKMTGHGFRAIASSALNEAGFRPDVIERQLAHREYNKVRRVYNRAEYLPERRTMMQQWADIVDSQARGSEVVPINRKARA